MKKLLTIGGLLTILLLWNTSTTFAQKTSFENVKKIRLRSSGSLINNGIIQGYYFFYKTDKVSRKKNAYRLEILDQNLEKVSSKRIEGPKNLILAEGAYNGSSIMLKFYDSKAGEFEFRRYDENSELISKKTLKVSKRYAKVIGTGSDAEVMGLSLYSVPQKGFVHILTKKNKKIGYQINYYPESGKGWKYGSDEKIKELQMAEFLGVNDNVLLLSVIKKKKLLSNKIKYAVVALDVNTGKKLFEKDMDDPSRPLQVMNAYMENDDLVLFGLYYKKKGDPIKDKSMGLFSYTLNTDGKVTNKEHISWAKHVSKHLPVSAKGKLEGKSYIYFHKMIKTADGKILAIGEQYKKAASGLGIASRALGGGGSLVKIAVQDLYIFEFTPEFKLNDVHVFEKQKTNVELPGGSLLYGPQMLAYMVNFYNGFDYSYTQRNQDNSVISVGYIDFEKRKKAKNSYVFGTVTYADGEYSTDSIDLGRRASNISVFPAKPGYVMITEYFRKDKKLDVRLEKINF